MAYSSSNGGAAARFNGAGYTGNPGGQRTGEGCGCGSDQKALLNRIRAYDFAAIEAALYLDMYECKDALAYFSKVTQTANELKKKYESLYGPLTQSGVNCENGWTWVDAPWPWEAEAN